MKVGLILIPLFLNIWIVIFQVDSFFLPLLAGSLAGAYKGLQNRFNIKSIFNLFKVQYSLKDSTRRIELASASLLSLSTDILSIVNYLKEGISINNTFHILILLVSSAIFAFLLFRFLFLNLLQEKQNRL